MFHNLADTYCFTAEPFRRYHTLHVQGVTGNPQMNINYPWGAANYHSVTNGDAYLVGVYGKNFKSPFAELAVRVRQIQVGFIEDLALTSTIVEDLDPSKRWYFHFFEPKPSSKWGLEYLRMPRTLFQIRGPNIPLPLFTILKQVTVEATHTK